MADVGKFFGSLIGTTASAANPATPVSAIVDGAAKIIGMFKLPPDVKAQLQAQLTEANIDLEKAQLAAQVAAMQGQLDIDRQEAASTSIWVAGWRPAVGWVCASALAWEFVLKPFLVFGLIATHHPPMTPLPVLDTATLVAGLLAPLLGLGGMRSWEKVQGTPDSPKLQ
jgi:Holin of 3TMs, for gene-transfer release